MFHPSEIASQRWPLRRARNNRDARSGTSPRTGVSPSRHLRQSRGSLDRSGQASPAAPPDQVSAAPSNVASSQKAFSTPPALLAESAMRGNCDGRHLTGLTALASQKQTTAIRYPLATLSFPFPRGDLEHPRNIRRCEGLRQPVPHENSGAGELRQQRVTRAAVSIAPSRVTDQSSWKPVQSSHAKRRTPPPRAEASCIGVVRRSAGEDY